MFVLRPVTCYTYINISMNCCNKLSFNFHLNRNRTHTSKELYMTNLKDPNSANSIMRYTGPPGEVQAPNSLITLGCWASFSSWYSESRSESSEAQAPSFRVLTATVVGPGQPPISMARARSTRPNSPSPRTCSIVSWLRGNSHFGSGWNEI